MEMVDIERLRSAERRVCAMVDPSELMLCETGKCVVDHVGLLLFSPTLSEGLTALRDHWYAPTPPVPSVVVKRRISERYGLDPRTIDIWITHLPVERARTVEVFLMCGNTSDAVMEAERAEENEAHWAARVTDHAAFAELLETLLRDGRFHYDGSGFNPYERRSSGGTTLCYLRRGENMRLELLCPGDRRVEVADLLSALVGV
ncbi:hypothetical protein [Nonomuraea glycinis]|uniref:hypothetical protein n=1 Tax=Nonomuraea glycinis TaxID=2047744 RepID=UPI00339DE29C